MDEGRCLPFFLKTHLLQKGKEVDISEGIRENFIPLVTAAFLCVVVELYSIQILCSKIEGCRYAESYKVYS